MDSQSNPKKPDVEALQERISELENRLAKLEDKPKREGKLFPKANFRSPEIEKLYNRVFLGLMFVLAILLIIAYVDWDKIF